MNAGLKTIAKSYFDLWQAGDFTSLANLFAQDVVFIGSLAKAHGIDECIKGMRGLANIMTGINIMHMWSDETDVITWYELATSQTNKPMPVVNWMHIENNKICKIRVVFDPRPLFGD